MLNDACVYLLILTPGFTPFNSTVYILPCKSMTLTRHAITYAGDILTSFAFLSLYMPPGWTVVLFIGNVYIALCITGTIFCCG